MELLIDEQTPDGEPLGEMFLDLYEDDTFALFNPPHLPRKSTALGMTADNKSMIVAAFALPIPKLIMVIPSAEALGIELFNPKIGTLK